MKKITIIGAGVVGMATASCLRRDGHDITVVDMRPPGEYCSSGNAGILSPGSCVPFGLPGNLKKVLQWLLDPLGPLAIRPGYFLRALPWLLRFQAASRMERVNPIADALRALLRQTLDAWGPLAQWAGVPDLIRRTGYLVVYESEQGFRGDALGWKIRRDRGVVCEDLDAARIREFEPVLRGIYAHGVFLPEQGFVANPLRLTQALAAQFRQDGGRILQRKVLDLEIGAGGPSALLTDAGRLPIETLVVCAGVHSSEFSTRLGSRVPLESQRGYHVHFENPTVTLRRPVLSGEGKFFATPMEMGLRVAGTVEFAGTEAVPDYARADALKVQAARMLPGLAGSNVTQWMGHRPCMPDSLPVIGPSPRFANVYFAFGHGHVGLCGGAPTARIIADLVAGRTPNIDIAPYRADRF
ncbi:MAG: FAD-dependent oxidoreductase [Betaproteobacteria bacterium]|nr:FAD-dependent oxidoreductase [Betaproteobacteria bacterium]